MFLTLSSSERDFNREIFGGNRFLIAINFPELWIVRLDGLSIYRWERFENIKNMNEADTNGRITFALIISILVKKLFYSKRRERERGRKKGKINALEKLENIKHECGKVSGRLSLIRPVKI